MLRPSSFRQARNNPGWIPTKIKTGGGLLFSPPLWYNRVTNRRSAAQNLAPNRAAVCIATIRSLATIDDEVN